MLFLCLFTSMNSSILSPRQTCPSTPFHRWSLFSGSRVLAQAHVESQFQKHTYSHHHTSHTVTPHHTCAHRRSLSHLQALTFTFSHHTCAHLCTHRPSPSSHTSAYDLLSTPQKHSHSHPLMIIHTLSHSHTFVHSQVILMYSFTPNS